MLKVCILSSVHNVFDTRIFLKEAMTLAKAGYEVVFIVQHDRAEVVDGVRIVPLPKPRNRFERMFWLIWKTFWLGLREKASVYHFHDPELIPAGLFLKLFSKKVIYDIHELVYFQIKNKYWIRNMIILQIAQNAYLFFEKMAVKYFDALIIAEDGYFDYFKSRYGDLKKLITVRNYPVIGAIENAISIPKKTDKAIIIYAGGLSKVRGIEEIIKAFNIIKDRAELWLIGKWENDVFRKMCETLDAWKFVRYLGYLKINNVYAYMKTANVGLAVLHPIENYLTSLPVKTFEYMTCGLPVVMSDFPNWRGLFGNCAEFVDPYDYKAIADKILYLIENKNYAETLGRNGKKIVLEKYCWETEGVKLLELYDKLRKRP